QQVARDIDNAKVSQVIYPLMQIEDVKSLRTNFVVAGTDQRKIYMLGMDIGKEVGIPEAVYLYTPIIPGLRGLGVKMSSSVSNSFISIRDKKEDIVRKINKAYCRIGDVENNPVLSIMKLIVFPMFDKIEVGEISFEDYRSLEKEFEAGKLHPVDLKNAIAEYLEKIISPIRKSWK
ncbi:tyrosine--tRNA ligase, partial [Candidatus Pacearchaeota archaeon]|nr:tyrosine--tRNA ligase [Candidatus Pacearchaeota archaeon]